MIIYFTGTGNSEYIAKALGDRLEDEVVDSLTYLKSGEKGIFNSEKPWVFVFPVYLSTIAQVFANFIRRSDFTGSKDAYFVGTCASEMGATANYCKEISEFKGFNYLGTGRVQMPQNYVALFKLTPEDECERRLKVCIDVVDEFVKLIKERKPLDLSIKSNFEFNSTKLVEKWYNKSFTKTKKYYVTDACTGCGLCAKMCPMNKISIVDKKAKWEGVCIHCMSCINRCPKHAIEYGKGTVGKGRYLCKKYKKTINA